MQTFASAKHFLVDDKVFALEVGKELLGVSKWPIYLPQAMFYYFQSRLYLRLAILYQVVYL